MEFSGLGSGVFIGGWICAIFQNGDMGVEAQLLVQTSPFFLFPEGKGHT